MPKLFLNDELIDAESARIDPRDAGLLHGIGVFTTLRVYNARPFRLDRHLARLTDSCQKLGLVLRHSAEQIAAAVTAVIEANGLADARLRITVTRGPIGGTPPAEESPLPPSTLLVAATGEVGYPAAYYEKGMAVAVAPERVNPTAITGGHKTLNYWPRLLTLQAARTQNCGEALWFTLDGNVACGCVSNVFVVRDGKLLTPPLETPILPGVTREAVLELAAADNIETEQRSISHTELFEAEEIFLTNSIMEVMPVVLVERQPVPAGVSQPKPGPLTRALAQLYRDLTRKETGA